MSFLKNHPFPVEAHFDYSLVLTFAVPKAALQPFLPPCLEVDTYDDKWAFIAVAMVQATGLRPKGFPKFMGNNFFLIGYRIFVRYTNTRGKRLRGLYILQSETDKKKMELLGNIFTHYKYVTTDISQKQVQDILTIQSKQSNFNIAVKLTDEPVALPNTSPFPDWKTARRYAGPLPFTFTYNPTNKTVLIIEGLRQNWTPKPVTINKYHINFIDNLNLPETHLANGFIIKNIPYSWKKGKIEKWQQTENPSKVS